MCFQTQNRKRTEIKNCLEAAEINLRMAGFI